MRKTRLAVAIALVVVGVVLLFAALSTTFVVLAWVLIAVGIVVGVFAGRVRPRVRQPSVRS